MPFLVFQDISKRLECIKTLNSSPVAGEQMAEQGPMLQNSVTAEKPLCRRTFFLGDQRYRSHIILFQVVAV
jgi:hypothetical protein